MFQVVFSGFCIKTYFFFFKVMVHQKNDEESKEQEQIDEKDNSFFKHTLFLFGDVENFFRDYITMSKFIKKSLSCICTKKFL